jgi:hypothetical protein
MSNLRKSQKRERYSRSTQGWNAQGFFSPSTAVIVDGATQTFSDLVFADPSSTAGIIGVYEDTGALHNNLITAGESVTIVQKSSDGNVKKSTELIGGDFTVTKTSYSAPVIQQDDVSPLAISIVGGLQEFVLSIRETTPGNQPFPVMEGRAIIRGGSPTDYDIITAILDDMLNTYDFERNADNAFANVDVTSDATGTALAAGNLTFSKGSTIVTTSVDYSTPLAVGNFVGVTTATGIATTVHSWFKVVAVTATQVTLDRPWPYDTEVIAGATDGLSETTANIDASVLGIRVSGVDELVHFDTAVSEDLADATITNTTDWAQGSGAAFQVACIEDECVVFDGQTTINAAFDRDYGNADLNVDDVSTDQYALYLIESTNVVRPSAGAPQNQTLMNSNIIIAAIEGSGLDTTLTTIFGT